MPTPNTTLRWGILGLGNIAHQFTKDLLLVPGNTLSAVASRDIQKAKEFASLYGAPQAYGTYEALFEDREVDIIYIGTPHDSHAQLSTAALNAGKHLLCEKPLAVNRKQVQQIIDAARKNQRFMMEALWSRFNPSIQAALQLIENKAIGEVNYINADFNFNTSAPDENRIFNMDLAGGALLDIGIYPVFLAYAIWGKPEQILASARFHRTGSDLQTSAILKYPQGFANIMCGVQSKSDMVAKIYGTQGHIFIDSRWHEAQGYAIQANGKTEKVSLPTLGKGFTYEIEECQRCIQSGELESKFWSQRNSLDLMEILDEIRALIGLKYPFE